MELQEARGWQARWGERCGDGLLLASIAWGVLAIGGTLPWSVAGLLILVALSTLVNAGLGRFRLDAGCVVLLGLGVYTAAQTLGFPVSWLSVIDREHGETWLRVLQALGSSRTAALSLEPDTTRFEAVRYLCYALTWATVSGHAKQQGPLTVVRWIVGVVVATALITVLHRILGVHQVYGVYAPQFAKARWVGPLLNPNNLGGLCNLGVFCALACSSRQSGPGNPVYLALAAGLACLTVLTGSRGATVALGGGALVFLGMWLHARQRLPGMQHWGLAYAVVAGLTLVALGLERAVIEDLSGRSVEKLSLMRWGIAVVGKHPWVGVGMGAFGAEAATVSGHSGNVAFPYVECFPLDLLTGLGVPVALVVLGAAVFGLWRIGGGFRTQTLRLGLGVVSIQNMMDLGLMVPGLALPWVSVFAACWGGATRRTWAANRPWLSWSSAVGALALGWVSIAPIGKPIGLLRREVAAKVNTAEGDEQLTRALARYPGDAYLLRLKAAVALRDHSPDALTWVNNALLRAPSDARTHLLLAQVLLSRRRVEQALPSLRLAAMDRTVHAEAARLVGVWAPNRLIDAAPDGPTGAAFLRLVAGNRTGEDRMALLEAAERRSPDDANTVVELTQERLRVARAENFSCEINSRCYQDLAAGVERAIRLGAKPSQTRILRALLVASSGGTKAAFDMLLAQCERSPEARGCLQVLVELGSAAGPGEYETAVSVFLDSVCGGKHSCSAERLGMAEQLVRRGRVVKAHEIYVQECSASGAIEAFVRAARTALQLGRAREALHWLEKGEKRHRDDPAALARLSAIRDELSAGTPAYTAVP